MSYEQQAQLAFDNKHGAGAWGALADTYKQAEINKYKPSKTSNIQEYRVPTGSVTVNDITSAAPDYASQIYQNQLDFYNKSRDDANTRAEEVFNAGKEQINRNTDNALADAYTLKLAQERNLPQQLAALGISGGGSESSLLGLENNYGNSRNNLEANRLDNIANLTRQLAEAKYNNEKSYNEGSVNAETSRLENLAKQYEAAIKRQAAAPTVTNKIIQQETVPTGSKILKTRYGGREYTSDELVRLLKKDYIPDQYIANQLNSMKWY